DDAVALAALDQRDFALLTPTIQPRVDAALVILVPQRRFEAIFAEEFRTGKPVELASEPAACVGQAARRADLFEQAQVREHRLQISSGPAAVRPFDYAGVAAAALAGAHHEADAVLPA